MVFSDRWMCFRAVLTDSSLCVTVRTLTFPREALPGVVRFPGASPEGVARVRACAEMSTGEESPGVVASCAEDSTGEESPGVDDCGYIRPGVVEEPSFCVRLVIVSALPWDVYWVCGSRPCLLDSC